MFAGEGLPSTAPSSPHLQRCNYLKKELGKLVGYKTFKKSILSCISTITVTRCNRKKNPFTVHRCTAWRIKFWKIIKRKGSKRLLRLDMAFTVASP